MLRVLPRDAFNDANLLKCIGKITLDIEDGICTELTYQYNGKPFNIQQDESDGSTYVTNIVFITSKGRKIKHRRPLNSREDWGLYWIVDNIEYEVFEEYGTVKSLVF
jgi:hypothetical protein